MITTTTASSYVKRPQISHTGISHSVSHLSFTALMYNTLFPRTNASPYLFFNWPLTYSCLFFFSRSVIIAISRSDERGNGNGTHTGRSEENSVRTTHEGFHSVLRRSSLSHAKT